MSTKYPVLIGSLALVEYGYNCKPKDVDILVDADLLENWKILFDNKANNIDLMIAKSGSNKDIFDYMNTSKNGKIIQLKMCKNSSNINVDVMIPPLEILYAIKKSHIHRVISYSQDSIMNVDIWKRNMESYIWMRNKLGYDNMDTIIYGNQKYGTPLNPDTLRNDDETELEFMVRRIFVKRFDEINEKHGDTFNIMNKNKNDFFDDNVPRVIDHDELHKMVAKVCRGIPDEPYKMFQKDTNNAVLDKELYFLADKKDRYTLLREEIMVLLLERKIIPELVHCNDGSNSYEFNKFKLMNYFNDVVSNYCTNLCESGHSWLRQYVLDHYDIYSKYQSYDMDNLLKLAFDIAKVNYEINSVNEYNVGYTDIFDMGEKLMGECLYWDTQSDCGETLPDIHFGISDNHYDAVTVDCIYDPIAKKTYTSGIISYDNMEMIRKLGDMFLYFHSQSSDCDARNNNLLYSPIHNVGICDEGMFVLDIKTSDSKHLSINVILFDHNNVMELFNSESKIIEFAKKRTTYCYYSDYDPTCGWVNEHHNDFHKLEIFGSCDGLMGKLCEVVARKIIDIDEDEYCNNSDYEYEDSSLDEIIY